jgi:hypothetical protein
MRRNVDCCVYTFCLVCNSDAEQICLSGKRAASLFAGGVFQPAHLNLFSSHATATVVCTSHRFPAQNAPLPKLSFRLHFTPAEFLFFILFYFIYFILFYYILFYFIYLI